MHRPFGSRVSESHFSKQIYRSIAISWSSVVKFIEVESSAEVGKVHMVFRMRLVFE